MISNAGGTMSEMIDVTAKRPWHDGLTAYHWVVLIVAALGWSFDTMDQWLYVQVKTPAITELLNNTLAQPATFGSPTIPQLKPMKTTPDCMEKRVISSNIRKR